MATFDFTKRTANITTDPEAVANLKRRAELKAIEDAGAAAEKERKALDAEYFVPLFESGSGVDSLILRGSKVLSIGRIIERPNINPKALLEKFPSAYAATVTISEYRVIRALK